MIDMWTGDIGTTLDKAADRGRLNDWLMALAPLGWFFMSQLFTDCKISL